MSVDVVTPLILHPTLPSNQHHNELLSMEQPSHSHQRARRRSGLTTTLLQLPVQHINTSPSNSKGAEEEEEEEDEDKDSFYDSRKPSLMSSMEDLTPEAVPSVQNSCISTLEQIAVARGWQGRDTGLFFCESPTHSTNRTVTHKGDDIGRKSSDPLVIERGNVMRTNREKWHRCSSDSERESKQECLEIHVCEEHSSIQEADSGFDDCRSKVLPTETVVVTSNILQTTPVLSSRRRRPAISPLQVSPASPSHPQQSPRCLTPEEQPSPTPPSSRRHSRRRHHLSKNHSMCSIGGSSDSYSVQSSLFECSSPATDVTDLLSVLGFGDFDDPQLIPDRFIPSDVSHARPSSMRQQSLLSLLQSSTSPSPSGIESDRASVVSSMGKSSLDEHSPYSLTPRPESPTHHHHSSSLAELPDLPLGATADNFLTYRTGRPPSPPPPSSQTQPPSEPAYSPATDPTISHYHPGYAPLEPVPEETASDLSPSPRWLSPRVSIDHSFDIAMGHLGACLSVSTAVRKRSLPNREGYRLSVESLVSEQDSIYFSVTSYDDDIAREKREREELAAQLGGEETTLRRRRKGVYEPPPQLLSWLEQQKPEEEEEDSLDEQPWPFNETAHLRKSLSELHEAQAKLSNPWERPLSPTFSSKVLPEYTTTRRSSYGEMFRRRSGCFIPYNYHRKSLPGNCRFHAYHPSTPPPPLPEVPSEVEMIVTESPIERGERLPPGMSRSEALGFKRECIQLRAELEAVKERFKTSEMLRDKEGRNFQKKLSDTEGYLRSELYRQEHRCSDLEEEVARCQLEINRLKTDTQLAVARGREAIRTKKDLEIADLRHKMEEESSELRKRAIKLEEECKQLHAKERHLLQVANQQSLKSEIDTLYKEVSQLKQQLNVEKQAYAVLSKEKTIELKKLKAKAQSDKEEALKMQKEALQKAHDAELATVRRAVDQLHHQPQVATLPSPSKRELKSLQQQVDSVSQLLMEKQSHVDELTHQIELLHKERLALEKAVADRFGKS